MVSRSIFSRELRLLFAGLFALLCTSAALAAPNPPTYLGAYAASSTSVVLLWNDNSTDETGFEIFQNGSSLGVTPANWTGVSLNVSSGASATYQVRAVNGSGNSAFAPSVTCTAANFNAPTNLAALVNKESVILSWADNATTETGFEIETRVLPSGTFALLGSIASKDVAVTDITGYLPPNASYEVRIRTRTGASAPYSYTGYSNTATLTTQFNAPTGLTATTASESTVNLSWVDNSAIEGGYAIYYRPSGSGSYTLLDYAAANATTYAVTGLTAGTAYDFQVAAAYQTQSNSILYSAVSNTATATTKDGFTSRTYQPITYNQAFSYQAVVSTASARTSWNITLPQGLGLTFNSSTGLVSGTPNATGVYTCPMTATFANGWTSNSSLTLRIIRAATAPVNATTISGQTLANGGNTSVSLTDKFSDADSESAVRIITNVGTMDFILYNTATPQTVTNFLSYVNNASSTGNYNGAVFHRSVPGFVVQGGGFKVQSAPNNFTSIVTTASPINEPGISSLRGTVAMAKLGTDPNSATDQFFVNLADNSSNLDNQNGGFTVFGRVAGSGMTVADSMAALPTTNDVVNVNGTANSSLTGWPLTSGTTMDTTKVVSITSAAPVPVLSYSVTGNTNPSAVTASISGTSVQINGIAGGQSNVTVTATDLDGNTVSQTFAVTVNAAPVFTSSAPTSPAVVGTAYNFTCTASGFPAPTFSVPANTLPPGLTLSSAGVISGTPTAPGLYSGTITATNSVSSATLPFSITVNQAPAFTNGPPPTTGVVGTAYSFTCTASGTPAPTFSVPANTLPPGLTLSSAGAITGTPTTTGVYTGAVTATNAAGSMTQNFSITINQAPTFTNGPPPATGAIGTAYSFTYTTNGTPAPTFSVTAGALPPGVTYDSAGHVTGTPTTAGTFTGTMTITNAAGSKTQDFNIVVPKLSAMVTLDVGSLSQTYDGTARVVTATTNPAGKTVTFTYNTSSTPPTNAGSYTVVGTIDDTNYTGTVTGTLVVAKATAMVTLDAGSLSQTYDGTARVVTATTNPAGKTVTFTYNTSSTPPTNAGSYTVVGTINDTNYSGTGSGTLAVAQAAATITLSGTTQTYDGSPKGVTATTSPAGLGVSLTYNGSSTVPLGFGTYTVAASITDANYTGSQSGTLIIQGQSSSAWKTQHFTSGQISSGAAADNADPDGDGLKNFAEYALGTDPLSPNTAPQPTYDANGLTLVFTRPKALPDVTYTAESTDNLGSWNSVTLEVINDGAVQTLRARDTLSSGNPNRRFMHLIFGTP